MAMDASEIDLIKDKEEDDDGGRDFGSGIGQLGGSALA